MQTEGRTDRHTDVMNLIAPFRNFVHAPTSSLTVQSDFLPLFEANISQKSRYRINNIVMIGQAVEIVHDI